MPSWLIWMFGIGGYLGMWVFTSYIYAKNDEDLAPDDELAFFIPSILIGAVWFVALPIVVIKIIINGMLKSDERRREAEERRKEQAERESRHLKMQAAEIEYWHKKAIEAEEANKALAEQYNRVVEGGSK